MHAKVRTGDIQPRETGMGEAEQYIFDLPGISQILYCPTEAISSLI